MSKDEYDGFYFLPAEEEDSLVLSYFKFNNDDYRGTPVGGTQVGDMFHIAFFKPDDEGMPVFDEEFEAIFADPTVYIQSLIGSELAGCVLRKTENSGKWWNMYLTGAKENCKMVASNL